MTRLVSPTLARYLAFGALLAVLSCSSETITIDDYLIPANRPPEITAVVPDDTTPTASVDDTLEFSVQVRDPDGDRLSYRFTMEDSLVSEEMSFVYTASENGFKRFRVYVTDGEFSLMHTWLLTVTTEPEPGDTIPPAQVENLGVEPGALPGKVIVRWRAVGDDGLEGRARRYIVATSGWPIVDEWTWQQSETAVIDGEGVEPGTEMSRVVSGPDAAQYTVAVVRAVDDSGNISAIGPYAEGYSRGFSYGGEVRDLLTGDPITGARVVAGDQTVVTDGSGRWSMEEMPFVSQGIIVSDDGVEGDIGDYYDFRLLEPNSDGAFHLVYMFPHYSVETTRYSGFLQFFFVMTDNPDIPYPTYLRHWDLPIQVYAEPATYGAGSLALDYKETVERVAVELNDHLGFEAFRAVSAPPDTGVACSYDPAVYADNFGYREWTEDWFPVKGEIVFRTIWNSGNVESFERIIRHELGHALGLRHSLDPIHLMVGGQSPRVSNFSEDELRILELMYYFTGEMAVGSYIED